MKGMTREELTATIGPRLWSKTDRSAGPDGCWLFMGRRNKAGYGVLSNAPKTNARLAHRVAWVLTRGAIPEETPSVLHKCDNPPCVNPEHLFLGTQADNVADMKQKGRQVKHPFKHHPERHNSRLYPELRRGENHGMAKLSESEVIAIRAAYLADTGRTYGKTARVARKFGIKSVTAQAIVDRRLWKHIPPLPGELERLS